jgi:pectin methylesterase-like acyl-CoA thioesterase
MSVALLLDLTASSYAAAATNLVVAADGTGQFKTVQEAIMALPAGSATNPVLIHIQPGTYRELIYVQRAKRFFHLLGADAQKTGKGSVRENDSAEEPLWSKSDSEKDHLRCIPRQFKSRTDEANA